MQMSCLAWNPVLQLQINEAHSCQGNYNLAAVLHTCLQVTHKISTLDFFLFVHLRQLLYPGQNYGKLLKGILLKLDQE